MLITVATGVSYCRRSTRLVVTSFGGVSAFILAILGYQISYCMVRLETCVDDLLR